MSRHSHDCPDGCFDHCKRDTVSDPKPDNWRPSWDAYHMAFAKLAATRGSCDRKRVGAVIVINNRLVATGYNGAQSGAPSCIQVSPARDPVVSPRVAIGFTGNRIGYDSGQPILGSGRRKATIGFWLQYLQLKLGPLEGHHGDCEGSDAAFHKQCLRASIPRVIHPPDKGGMRAMIHQVDQFEPEFNAENWTKILPPKPYLDRNQDIVDISKVLLAAPSDFVEEQRSGTWATIRRARAAKLWTILVYPDGTWADDRPEFRPEWCKVPDRCWCELGVNTQCQMCFNGMPYCSCNFCNWPDEYDHRWGGDQCLMCGFDATDAQAARLSGHELPNCNTMRA